jgi:uncharacterized protein YndB with AHSA1/START domain
MKIVKKIIFGLIFIVAILLIAGLFIKKEYAVEREITINKPIDSVFNYVKYMKNQDNFSVWNKKDPNSIRTFKNTDGEVGFIYSWDSKNDEIGAGEQEIIKITPNERIDFELRFKRPFEGTDKAYFITESVSNDTTKIKWGFNGSMKYPMNLLLPIMDMENMLGKDLQKGLDDLKIILEKK